MIRNLAHVVEAALFGAGTMMAIGSCVVHGMRSDRFRPPPADSKGRTGLSNPHSAQWNMLKEGQTPASSPGLPNDASGT
jgi:hypothetical protein